MRLRTNGSYLRAYPIAILIIGLAGTNQVFSMYSQLRLGTRADIIPTRCSLLVPEVNEFSTLRGPTRTTPCTFL